MCSPVTSDCELPECLGLWERGSSIFLALQYICLSDTTLTAIIFDILTVCNSSPSLVILGAENYCEKARKQETDISAYASSCRHKLTHPSLHAPQVPDIRQPQNYV